MPRIMGAGKKKKKKSGKKPGRPGGKYKFIEPLRGARRIAGY